MRYHWQLSAIEDQILQLKKIHTDDNIADVLTKVFFKEKLEPCAKFATSDGN